MRMMCGESQSGLRITVVRRKRSSRRDERRRKGRNVRKNEKCSNLTYELLGVDQRVLTSLCV